MRIAATFIILCYTCFLSQSLFAQKEAENWCFGSQASVSFSNGTPISTGLTGLNAFEGCATISDSLGNLLFYTDGVRVIDRLHATMPNGSGLLGSFSSSQSSIIVPGPGSNNIYYVFTADAFFNANGIHYSEVDMTLNGGRGDVTVNKNIPLYTPACEKLTAVLHANGTDVWVISHESNNANFVAHLITAAGVNPVPVISTVGTPITNFLGYLKASPDGKRLASANGSDDIVEVFDFDDATGTVSSPMTFTGFQAVLPYGVSFSPNGQMLYISEDGFTYGNIYQFDLSLGTQAAIDSSRNIIAANSNRFGALQLGIDGKLYATALSHRYLAAINFPDFYGPACDYVDTAVSLFPQSANYGLPNFIESYFAPNNFSFINHCLGDSTRFIISGSQPDSVLWVFDDTASGPANLSDTLYPVHLFSDTGEYSVSLIVYSNATIDTITKVVRIEQYPVVDLGMDTVLCNADSWIVMSNNVFGALTWQDGDTNQIRVINAYQSGTYILTADNLGCMDEDTVRILFISDTIEILPNDTALCLGDSLMFQLPQSDGVSYIWQDGDTGTVYFANDTGLYWLEVTTLNCVKRDSFFLAELSVPGNLLPDDTIVCQGQFMQLDAAMPGAQSYRWSTGHITANPNIFLGFNADTFEIWVEISFNACTLYDTVTVYHENGPANILPDAQGACFVDSIVIASPLSASYNHLWSDSTTGLSMVVKQSGTYWLQSENGFCFYHDSIEVTIVRDTPEILGNDTIVCKGESLVLDATVSGATYIWSTGTNQPLLFISDDAPGTYCVWVVLGGCIFYECVTVGAGIDTGSILLQDTSMCVGDTLRLFPLDTNVLYTWQDTIMADFLDVTDGGMYYVVRDTSGCVNRDTILVIADSIAMPILEEDTFLCAFDTIVLTASPTNATYLWNTNATDSLIEVTAFGQYHVEVSLGNCTAMDTINIFRDSIIIDVLEDTTVCQNAPLQLDATTANATYLWNDNSNQPTLQTSTPGVYWVDVNVDGCVDRDSAQITHSTVIATLTASDTLICEGETAMLDATLAGATYLWNDNSTQPTLSISTSGDFWVIVSIGGCSDSLGISIDVISLPTDLIIPQDTTMCSVDLLIDASSWGQSWQWQNGSTGPTFQATQPGLYWVIASDLPCEFTDSITVTKDCPDTVIPAPPPCHVRIPTAISANYNGINDRFETFITECAIAHYEMQIYNRWGEMVFQTFDPNNYWDATYQGESVPLAVYVYSLVIIDEEGRRYQKKGNVTVLR